MVAHFYTKFDWYIHIYSLRYCEIKATRLATSVAAGRYNRITATAGTWRQWQANGTDSDRHSHIERPTNIAGASVKPYAVTRVAALVMTHICINIMPAALTGLPQS